MAKRTTIGTRIEGRSLEINGQDIRCTNPPQFASMLSGETTLVFPISVYKRGQGEIVEAFPDGRPRYRGESLTARGEGVSGKTLWGFATDVIDNIRIGGSGRTARHSGQTTTITGECFLQIVASYDRQGLPVHPKESLSRGETSS